MAKKQKPTEKFENAIIIGPMPFSKKLLSPAWKGKLIFVDGGLIHQKTLKQKLPFLYKTALSVGDGDGSSKVQLDLWKNDQNISDLAFCLHQLRKEKRLKKIILLGFLGGRRDHELFNLGEVGLFLNSHPKVHVYLDDMIEFLPPGTHTFDYEGLFSLGSLTSNQIRISGQCLYPLEKWTKIEALSSLGLSNEAHGLVNVFCKKPLMLIYSERSGR